MRIGERIARIVAPQAVGLKDDFVARMREENRALKKRVEFQEREIKRLRRVIKDAAPGSGGQPTGKTDSQESPAGERCPVAVLESLPFPPGSVARGWEDSRER